MSQLTEIMHKVPAGNPCSLVYFYRYTRPRVAVGVHLVVHERRRYSTHTVGLFSLEAFNPILSDFTAYTTGISVGVPFRLVDETLQAFIRQQVLPVEFKSMSTAELSDKNTIGLKARDGVTARRLAWAL